MRRTPIASMALRPRRMWCGALATAIVLAACGSSSSPKDQVSRAWTDLKHALVAGDAKQLCALLSDQARAQFIEQISTVASASTCEGAAATLFDVARDARKKIASASLTSVNVEGNRATTTDSTGPPPNYWIKAGNRWELQSLSTQ